MEVVGSGVIWDARSAPVNERSASATSAIRLSDGTVLATCRLGTDREGPDGHTGVFASTDRGETWELRYLSLPEREWDGWPGETRGWYIAELTPGVLTASVLWTDRTDPADPWVHPVTQGLLGMRVYQLISTDGGRTLARTPADRPRRRTRGHRRPARSSSSPAASSPSPSSTGRRGSIRKPGRPAAWLRLSTDGGATWPDDVLVAHHPDDAIYYWDQRLETHPDDGRLVNMFWTRDVAAALDIDVHIAWGTPDGRDWTVPVGTGLPGQHCQPISLGGDRLLAVYSHRGDPPGIRAALSEDFGRTWDRASEIVVWASDAGGEPGAGRPRSQDEYWNDMGAWQFGHPRGATLPDGEVLVVFYGGSGATRSARWARVRV